MYNLPTYTIRLDRSGKTTLFIDKVTTYKFKENDVFFLCTMDRVTKYIKISPGDIISVYEDD